MRSILILVFLFCILPHIGSAQINPAVLFKGDYGSIIPSKGLEFRDGKYFISGADDPSSTATEATTGSIYISSSTGLTYQKQDNGSTTNWTPLYFVPIFTDDNRLVRTDGTSDVQQSGISVTDSDEVSGITQLDVDDVRIDGFEVSTTATDQPLELSPDGDGTVDITYLSDSGSAVFTGTNGSLLADFPAYRYSTLDQLLYVPGLRADNVQVNDNTISTTDTDGDLILSPNGTGEVQVDGFAGGQLLESTATGGLSESTATTADIEGKLDKFPAETNDNRLARTDGNGNALQGSSVVLDDAGALSALTELTVDNLNLNGNTISTTDTDGDLVLDPNGTASVQAPKLLLDGITEPAHQEGLLFYDSDLETLSFFNAESEITLNIGEESWVEVRNNTGSTITEGSVVYISGATGLRPEISLAQADVFTTSKLIGVVAHDIETSSNGYVNTQGVVRSLDTSSFSDGDTLYLSPTVAGGFTATRPSKPNVAVLIGTVVNAHVSQGRILVSPEGFPAIGFTEGAISFGDSNSVLIEDPTNLSWDDAADTLTVNDLDLTDSTITATATDVNVDLVGNGDGRVRIDRGGTLYEAGSINPELPELLADPSFEVSDAEWTCTAGASTTQITTAANVTEGSAAVQIDFTSDGASCSLTESVADGKADVSYQHGISLKTSDSTVTLGFLDDTRTVSEPEVLANGAFVDYITQTIPSTSVKTTVTGDTGDQVFVDAAFMRRGSLPTGPSRNCGSDLECENVPTGFYDASEGTLSDATKNQTPSQWVTAVSKSGSNDFVKNLTVKEGVFSETPDCQATPAAEANNGAQAKYRKGASTATDLEFITLDGGSADDLDFTISCPKGSNDYKSPNQQGVAYTGGNEGAFLSLNNSGVTSNQTIGNGTITVSLDTVVESRNISWDTTDDEMTILKTGRYAFTAIFGIDTDSASGAEAYLEKDAGGSYSKIEASSTGLIGDRTGNSNLFTLYYVGNLDKGDKVRWRIDGSNGSDLLYNQTGIYPKMFVTPAVDRGQSAIDLNGTPKYEGEGRMIQGVASFGGGTDESVCNSSPCTRYRELGEEGVAGEMSVTRSSTGLYDLNVTAFRANSAIFCSCNADSGAGDPRQCNMKSTQMFTDSSGEADIEINTPSPGSTDDDTYINIKCEGLAP